MDYVARKKEHTLIGLACQGFVVPKHGIVSDGGVQLVILHGGKQKHAFRFNVRMRTLLRKYDRKPGEDLE